MKIHRFNMRSIAYRLAPAGHRNRGRRVKSVSDMEQHPGNDAKLIFHKMDQQGIRSPLGKHHLGLKKSGCKSWAEFRFPVGCSRSGDSRRKAHMRLESFGLA
jgi:hypothetical protein